MTVSLNGTNCWLVHLGQPLCPATPPPPPSPPHAPPHPPHPPSECLCPVVLTRGGDQLPVSTKFDMRSDPQVIRNYGAQQHVVAVAVGSGGMPCHGWLGPSMLGMLWRALPDPARATCTRIDQGSPSSRPMPLPLATISPAPNRRPHAG